ncbi:MAG: nitronate monooxygenase [Thermodesulfobacteriota bacterium]|nr:nitronate monooxygenase [Thermodesulfobacteriota bacterium]
MLKTRVTEMLGIEYPIIGGTMQWLSRAELVAAQSNAGCLGIIPSATFSSKEELVEEIRKTKSLTDKPFAVNINLFPMMRPFSIDDMIEAVHEEGIKIVETSGRNPAAYIEKIKKNGAIHMHKCARVRDAVKAEKEGIDTVTIVGIECGGHPSGEEVTTLVLLSKTVDSVSIPVMVGGGISNGRGLAAALVMGAEGVVIGTRFIATRECPIHDNFKNLLVDSEVTATTLLLRSAGAPLRAYRNKVAEEVLDMEAKGTNVEEILPTMSGIKGKEAYMSGDLNGGVFPCGQSAGLINRVMTVREMVEEIIKEAEEAIRRISGQ